MKAIFEQIYADNVWRFGSGEGSLPVHTRGYVAFLQRFLRDRRIRSVVDFGCGDWQFSRGIDWSGIDYVGCEVVPELVRSNRARFGAPNVRFMQVADERATLPPAELLIVKDVLQHWSNASILAFLPQLARYRYALVTNCVDRAGRTANRDAPTGDFRGLDLREPPFSIAAAEVFAFENSRLPILGRLVRPRWRKKVLLVENPPAAPRSASG